MAMAESLIQQIGGAGDWTRDPWVQGHYIMVASDNISCEAKSINFGLSLNSSTFKHDARRVCTLSIAAQWCDKYRNPVLAHYILQ